MSVSASPSDLAIVHYRPEHAEAWRSLNTTWILAGGYAIEPKDELVLGDPDGAILSKGGVIFIAELEGAPVGCCSLMAMADGGFEVGKMAVDAAARTRPGPDAAGGLRGPCKGG